MSFLHNKLKLDSNFEVNQACLDIWHLNIAELEQTRKNKAQACADPAFFYYLTYMACYCPILLSSLVHWPCRDSWNAILFGCCKADAILRPDSTTYYFVYCHLELILVFFLVFAVCFSFQHRILFCLCSVMIKISNVLQTQNLFALLQFVGRRQLNDTNWMLKPNWVQNFIGNFQYELL